MFFMMYRYPPHLRAFLHRLECKNSYNINYFAPTKMRPLVKINGCKLMMRLNRFVVVAANALLLCLSFSSHAAVVENRTWQVADNVYRFGAAAGNNGYYSMFIVTEEGRDRY